MVYSGMSVDIGLQADQLSLGTVLHVVDPTTVVVEVGGNDRSETRCRILQTSDVGPLTLSAADEVVVWLPPGVGTFGIVLGRVSPAKSPPIEASPVVSVPEELVLEASEQITLKCGSGSITIREDGKVLIKGRDLVSRAERTNRIKGGAVAIN